jgi:hypothetical protein
MLEITSGEVGNFYRKPFRVKPGREKSGFLRLRTGGKSVQVKDALARQVLILRFQSAGIRRLAQKFWRAMR